MLLARDHSFLGMHKKTFIDNNEMVSQVTWGSCPTLKRAKKKLLKIMKCCLKLARDDYIS